MQMGLRGCRWGATGDRRHLAEPDRLRTSAAACRAIRPTAFEADVLTVGESRFYSGLAERHGAKVSFEQSRAPAWASVFHQGQGPKIKIKPERPVSEQHNPPARGCSGDADGAIYVVFRCDRLRHIAAMRHRA